MSRAPDGSNEMAFTARTTSAVNVGTNASSEIDPGTDLSRRRNRCQQRSDDHRILLPEERQMAAARKHEWQTVTIRSSHDGR